MVQDLNDETSQLSGTNTQNSDNEGTEDEKKRVHWSGVQMQGFQSHQHMQLFQRETTHEKEQFTQHHNKVESFQRMTPLIMLFSRPRAA